MNKNLSSLYKFSYSLAYLNSIHISRTIQKSFADDNSDQIKRTLIPRLASRLNASQESLQSAYAGSHGPMNSLLMLAESIGARDELLSYLHNSLPTLKRRPAGLVRSRHASPRTRLIDYFRAVCYLQGTTMAKASETMGDTKTHWLRSIKKDSRKRLEETTLSEVPFTLDATKKDILSILSGDYTPMHTLARNARKRVMDRQTLVKYVSVCAYLAGVTPRQLSKAIGSNMESAVLSETRERLASILKKAERVLHADFGLDTLLIQANVRKAGETVLPRTYFKICYGRHPIGPCQSEDSDHYDRSKVNLHIHAMKRVIRTFGADWQRAKGAYRRATFGEFKKRVTWQFWKILTAWSYMYDFDDRRFLTDNFKFYGDKYKKTGLLQQGSTLYFVKPDAWLKLVQKLHVQLEAVHDAFDMKSVADSSYGKYCYQLGLGAFSDPHTRNYHANLALMDGQRKMFRATVQSSVLSRMGSEPYCPCVRLMHVTQGDRLVAVQTLLRYGKNLRKLGGLQRGDLIEFTATPKPYWTGKYHENSLRRKNYRLTRPDSFSILQQTHLRRKQPVPGTKHALVGYCLAHDKTDMYDFSGSRPAYLYIRKCKQAYRDWKNEQK